MSYGERRYRKGAGIVLLMIIGLIVLITFQQGETIVKEEGFMEHVDIFPNGEKITQYEIPAFLTPEQEALLAEFAEKYFFTEQLPEEFIEVTRKQELAKQNATTTTLDSNLTSTSDVTETPQQLVITSGDAGNIYKRGFIVPISGKIEKVLTPPQYFFNVIITCCDMNSFKAMSAVETDFQGNFLVNIATDQSYPLGDWTVIISTIGDNKEILRSYFDFKLVE